MIDSCSIFPEWKLFLSNGGENYAVGTYSAKMVHNSWMNSPGHKKQIMKDYGTNGYIGIAKVYGSDGYSYWVEEFATTITSAY